MINDCYFFCISILHFIILLLEDDKQDSFDEKYPTE